jgi:hydroxymethylbilane synthase
LTLKGFVGDLEGRRVLRGRVKGKMEKAEALGAALAEDLLSRGAGEILKELYGRETPFEAIDGSEA